MEKIGFIVNPISGTIDKTSVMSYIKETFDASANYSCSYLTLSEGKDAAEAAREFSRAGGDVVVAVGGDGTVNRVACGLVGSRTKMAIIPVGSGNGLARHLHIPLDYKEAVDLILKEKSIAIDAGVINGQHFFCTAGLGFEAVVGNRFNTSKQRGLISYINFCAQEYLRYRPENYILNIEGNTYNTRAFLITFANAAQWGNDAYIAPEADITDGLLDVVVWKKAPAVTAPILAAELFLGTILQSPEIDMYRCRSISIIREKDGLIQFDGESRMVGTSLSVSCIRHAVNIIVP